MKIHILYSTDTWNTKASQEVISIHKRHETAVKAAKRHSEEDEEPLTREQVNQLLNESQTQLRFTNYIIEEHILND